MEEPVQIKSDSLHSPLLEPLLGIHSAPSVNWLADSTATAAERGLGALYTIFYVTDASGRLSAVTPASGAQKGTLARLSQAFGFDIGALKIDPEERPKLAAALAEGRALCTDDLNDALPQPLDDDLLMTLKRELGVASAIVAPFYRDGESSGLLLLLVGRGQAGFVDYAESLARHVAVALANLRERDAGRKRGEVDAVRWVYDERRFSEELGQESRRAKRHERPLSVLFVRILNLEELQARYGRFLADRVLRQVAGRLDDAMRDTDFLGASASDGFGAILIEADQDGADMAEERLLAGLHEMKLPHTDLPDLEVQLGCATATLPQDGETADELTAAAGSRLQQRSLTQQDSASAV